MSSAVAVIVLTGCGRLHFEYQGRAEASVSDGDMGGDGAQDGATPSDGGDASGPGDAGNVVDANLVDASQVDASSDTGVVLGSANIAFVTQALFAGDLGGLSGADQKCQQEADAAGLPGSYVALLSNGTLNALDRLQEQPGWVRTDGRVFVSSVQSLRDRRIFYPLMLDALGNRRSGSAHTGTDIYGQTSASRCQDWTVADGDSSMRGMVDAGNERWLGGNTTPCSNLAALYCFSIDRGPAPAPDIPSGGRIMFVAPWADVVSIDQSCQQAANNAGLNGTFTAAVATTAESAAERVGLTGFPWKRPDGAVVFNSLADLQSGLILAPPIVQANGAFGVSIFAMTGGPSFFEPASTGAQTCEDWTSRTAPDTYKYGTPYIASPRWFSWGFASLLCDSVNRNHFCLSQ